MSIRSLSPLFALGAVVFAVGCAEPIAPDGEYQGLIAGGLDPSDGSDLRFVDAEGRVLGGQRDSVLRLATTDGLRVASLTLAPLAGSTGATCTIPWGPVRHLALEPASTCVLDGVEVTLTSLSLIPSTFTVEDDDGRRTTPGVLVELSGTAPDGDALYIAGALERAP